MLAENLNTQCDEYKATDGFNGEPQFVAYEATDEAAGKGKDKGGQSDGKQGEAQLLDGVHADAGEGDAYCKGIDAYCQ